MSSLRKLRRRALRWDRYADKTYRRHPGAITSAAHVRALFAVADLCDRRNQALPPHVVTQWDLTEAGLL